MRNLFLLICLFGVSTASWSQGKLGTWENLASIREGQRIQVVENDSRKVSGKLLNFTDATISLQAEGGPQTIERQDVRSVRIPRGKRRLRNTLIAAGVGAGVGAAIGAADFRPCAPTEWLCIQPGGRALPAAIVGTGGLLVGGIVGVLLPTHSTIYRVRSR